MLIYKHRQIAILILFTLGFGVVLTVTALILVSTQPVVVGSVLVILLLCILLFWSLTIEVTADRLVVSFGPGVIRKSFRIKDIHDVRIVRNPWYYGWGIRLTPHGWLFNVSGFDAVEMN
jgi:energy-coupling factor transporter transmembrane protein EcfT